MTFITQLEPLDIIIALLSTLLTILWFFYPEGREKFRRFCRHLISHSLTRKIIIVFLSLFVGVGIGYYFFYHPQEDTLKLIRERQNGQGLLKCGISGDVPGFSYLPEDKVWEGIDVDYCRALAIAILGDAKKVDFVRLKARKRFDELTQKKVDVLFRNTSWTVGRTLGWNVDFGPPIFIDRQALLVHSDSGINTYSDLEQKRICVLEETTSYHNLKAYLSENSITPKKIVTKYQDDEDMEFENNSVVFDAFFGSSQSPLGNRNCDAMTTDSSQIFGQMSKRQIYYSPEEGFEGYRIIEDPPIGKELLSPVFRSEDKKWRDIVTHVVWATIYAEELGITSENIDKYNSSSPLRYRELLGIDALIEASDDEKIERNTHIGDRLGLDRIFVQKIIREVGNYQEIFERNLRHIVKCRGPNQVWLDRSIDKSNEVLVNSSDDCPKSSGSEGILNPPPFSTKK